MFIDDEEMRQIFKEASEERLQKLDEGLLELEKDSSDAAVLNDILREAHSLKGDANMLGVTDVGTLAHTIEDILNSVKRGEVELSSEISDRLYRALDDIRQLVEESVTGESAGVDLFKSLAHLMGATVPDPTVEANAVEESEAVESVDSIIASVTTAPAAETSLVEVAPTPPEPIQVSSPVIVPQVAIPAATPPQVAETVTAEKQKNEPVTAGSYRIETIRVETNKLDTLMTQAGELTVSKIRIAHRLNEIEEIVALWEDWSRDALVNRFAFNQGESNEENQLFRRSSSQKARQTFHHRTEERLERLGGLINRLRNTTSEDSARLEVVATELEEGIRTLRLLPLSTIFNLCPRMVRDLSKQQGKEINLIIEGGETRADKRILEEMKDPLMHMIRNAIDHGIETPGERKLVGKPAIATLRLKGYQTASSIIIELSDDGRGLATESIKQTALKRGICREEELATMTPSQLQSLIFAPGFSTRSFVTEVSGRGVGLDVVRTNVERLKGSIHVDSHPGNGTTFRIQLGSSLATAHVLIVEVDSTAYAIPVEFVETTLLIKQQDIFSIEGRETILIDGQPVSIAWLTDLLEVSNYSASSKKLTDSKLLPCIIIKMGDERVGLLVNALLDEQDVVLKPQSQLMKRVRNISGATILGTGQVCMVLSPPDLLKSVRGKTALASSSAVVSANTTQRQASILLVEDSITIRTQEKRILEGAGYRVMTAVDGLDGYDKFRANQFDAVVSDVEMPNLDGLSLTARIRKLKEFSEVPIVLVTSLAKEEDKRRGAEAGANAYITKGSFDQKVLLDTLKRLI